MKIPLGVISAVLFLRNCLMADEYVNSKSPDRNFALQVIRDDKQPYRQKDSLVDLRTRAVVLQLDADHPFDPQAKLLWSPDSQWVAYWHHPEEGRYDSEARVFGLNGVAFEEMKFPELPTAKFSETISGAATHNTRIKPLRWIKPGQLELEVEVISETGGRGAMMMVIQFERQRQPAIVKAARESASIVDYFLLLPKEEFEAPPLAWLDHNARVIDKENGYISVTGDGAQPSFEVALFRYRDGRPLIGLCSGELEGPDSVDLKFFESGGDGKMHERSRNIFPIARSDGLKYDLPRAGRTIVVRNLKTGKILHRVSWNGERFIADR